VAHPRSAFGAPPPGGAAGGPAKPVPRRLLGGAGIARRGWRFFAGFFGSLLGSLLATSGARAVVLPENVAEAMAHTYSGGGVTASGPALLVRKNMAERFALTGTYYADIVSNASIDVVTTASPYRETRNVYGLGGNYLVRDTLITVAAATSREPDYIADAINVDLAQDVFGGMTTVSLGFTKGSDQISKKGDSSFNESADHWRYRLGVTQVLTPSALMSANFEAISDDGFLANPYRVALVFGAAVPERVPSTRSSRALQLRGIVDLGERNVVRGAYRYFWDNWGIRAHTFEVGYARYFGKDWMGDAFVRYHAQTGATFFSNNATTDTTYVTRNRQLSDFNDIGLGLNLAYTAKTVPGKYSVTITGGLEFMRFDFNEFTDVRNGQLYSFNAYLAQLVVSLTY
jgi:hypothetical protein